MTRIRSDTLRITIRGLHISNVPTDLTRRVSVSMVSADSARSMFSTLLGPFSLTGFLMNGNFHLQADLAWCRLFYCKYVILCGLALDRLETKGNGSHSVKNKNASLL